MVDSRGGRGGASPSICSIFRPYFVPLFCHVPKGTVVSTREQVGISETRNMFPSMVERRGLSEIAPTVLREFPPHRDESIPTILRSTF